MLRSTMRPTLAASLFAATALLGWAAQAAPVTTEDLLSAQDNAAEWLMYGRDYRNQRFRPLAQITPENVEELRPVWAFSTGGQFAGLEATALMRDDVLYVSTDYARVFALDARTGTTLWSFEPEYEEGPEAMLCCGPVNRGVALKDDLVFVNTLDARLTGDQLGFVQALDDRTGETLWKFQTGSGINASPITYELDGTQYVAILSGLGGDPSFYFKGPKGGMVWVCALESAVPGAEVAGGGMNPVPIEGALPTFEQ